MTGDAIQVPFQATFIKGTSRKFTRILLLQSCGVDHFLSAARTIHELYPSAELVGLVEENNMSTVLAAGRFSLVRALPEKTESDSSMAQWVKQIHLCVVPFESRLGVYHWTFRRFPIACGIPWIASYNRRGRLRIWNRKTWIINSVVICAGLRAIHRPAIWVWLYVRRWLDVAGLFCLTLVAHLFRIFSCINHCEKRPLEGKRRRVVLFIPSLGMGGAQRQFVTFLQYLDRNVWDPEVVMLNLPDNFFDESVRRMGVPITRLNSNYEFWMTGVVWRLTRHLRTYPCQVLHCWMHYAAMIGSVAGTFARVPVIIASPRSEAPVRFPHWYPRWQRAIDILTAPLQTIVAANSNQVRLEAARWAWVPQRKLRTIYNGIDVEAPTPSRTRARSAIIRELNLPVGAPLVGTIGRLCPEKDYKTFLHAVARVAAVVPDAQFLIVGDGEQKDVIVAEIERLGLNGKVTMLGRRTDILSIMASLDVFVMTSLSEGLPNVLLEAALVGTPVVSTAAGGAAEVVEDDRTGFLAPIGDAETVGARIITLLRDPELRDAFGQAAQARTRRLFSASRMAADLQACYTEATGSRGNSIRPVRVCFLSTQAYGVLNPTSRLPFGGAELQVCRLARELTRDSRMDVSIMTGDRGRIGIEKIGGVTVLLSDLFRKLQVLPHDEPPACGMTTENAERGAFTGFVKRALSRLPESVAHSIKNLVRTAYAVREATVAVPMRFVRRFVERCREGLECWAWLKQLFWVNADVYVMRCASPQVGYVELVCRLLRRRFVYMVAHEADVSGAYAEKHGVWGRRFEHGLRRADVIVCQHEDQLGLLRARTGRTGVLIRSLCPTEISVSTWEKRTAILWVARMDEWKGPDLFLDLATKLPQYRFIMVGPPSDIDAAVLPRILERINTVSNVRWMARLPIEETATLFNTALVFVNTSQAEGFPNTFLQAAAAGTPIVSWAVDPGHMLERYEIGYCADRQWEKFEGSVRRLTMDAAMRERLGENGRAYVRRHHDPAVIGAQYRELFLRLMCEPNSLQRTSPVSQT